MSNARLTATDTAAIESLLDELRTYNADRSPGSYLFDMDRTLYVIQTGVLTGGRLWWDEEEPAGWVFRNDSGVETMIDNIDQLRIELAVSA